MNKISKDFIFKDNPRKITDKQPSRLESDLRKFGDLSGVVYCRNNKAYVGGNQRSKIFDGSQITLIKEYDEPLQDKTVAVGFIEWNGSRYLYREVEFSESEFREACIVANNDGGDWDFDLLKEWDNFREQYGEIIRQSVDMLKDNSFACFVVGEVRNKKTGYYRKLINETVNAFERAGASFYNELILVNVAGSLPIRAATSFKSRKIGKCHQNVLVFYKGNASKIRKKFPEMDLSMEGFDLESLTQTN